MNGLLEQVDFLMQIGLIKRVIMLIGLWTNLPLRCTLISIVFHKTKQFYAAITGKFSLFLFFKMTLQYDRLI